MATHTVQLLDDNRFKTGFSLTIVLLLTAFVIDAWQLVAFVVLSQFLGAAEAPFAPYRLFYRYIARPSGLVKPNFQPDHPEPHRFAMLVAALCDLSGILAILAGAPVLGWALIWFVIILANLRVWIGFCLGCWFYYQLGRLGVPGFTKAHT